MLILIKHNGDGRGDAPVNRKGRPKPTHNRPYGQKEFYMESNFYSVYVKVEDLRKLLEEAEKIGSDSVSFGVEDNHVLGQKILWVAGYVGKEAKRIVTKLSNQFK